jgi:cytochrome c-type biogenesis protein CcmE
MFKTNKNRGSATGAVITAVICVLAIGGVVFAFIANSSPYVTVAQAKTAGSDRMHLAADIIKESVHQDLRNHTLNFTVKDPTGEVEVVYTGTPPQNMGEATKVVAIGEMKDGKFKSDKLLVKCPSKYESENKT